MKAGIQRETDEGTQEDRHRLFICFVGYMIVLHAVLLSGCQLLEPLGSKRNDTITYW